MSQLHFTDAYRQHAITIVTVYSREFKDRVLQTLDDIAIEEEADSDARAWRDEQIDHYAFEDVPDHLQEHIEEGIDEGTLNIYNRVQADLSFVKNQINGLAIAGLYHLWERLTKEFLVEQFAKFDLPNIPSVNDINNATFEDLIKLFARSGWKIKTTPFYPDLNRLRLVANVIKHGDGKSYNSLLKKAPYMFRASIEESRNNRSIGYLELSPKDFTRLGQPVLQFFYIVPEYLQFS
jgi:hypothetical protein